MWKVAFSDIYNEIHWDIGILSLESFYWHLSIRMAAFVETLSAMISAGIAVVLATYSNIMDPSIRRCCADGLTITRSYLDLSIIFTWL